MRHGTASAVRRTAFLTRWRVPLHDLAGGFALPAFEARFFMSSISKAALLPLWALAGLPLVLAPARAQTPAATAAPASTAAPGSRADPTDPRAMVPPARYDSALRAYPGFAEAQVAPWRETNDRVRQRGGWRAYAREAGQPDPAQAAPPPAAPAGPAPPAAPAGPAPPAVPAGPARPASGGHAGHGTK